MPTQRRRLGMIAGIGLVAVIIAVVAVAISSSGTHRTGLLGPGVAKSTDRAVAQELRGIPQQGTTLGEAGAPITIQYFGDLECPYCAALTLGRGGAGLPQVIAGPVRHGQVKLVYRSAETAGGANDNRWIPQAGRRLRRRPAAPLLGLRRALLPRAGR